MIRRLQAGLVAGLCVLLAGCPDSGASGGLPLQSQLLGPGFEARLSLPSETLAFADPLRLELEVVADTGLLVELPEASDSLAAFLPIDFRRLPTESRQGRRVLRQLWQLEALDTGVQRIPGLPLRYRVPGDSWQLAFLPALELVVVAELPASTGLDSLSVLQAGQRWEESNQRVLWWGAGLACLLLAVLLIWWLLRRPRAEPPAPPPPDPVEVALGRLRGLKARDLPGKGALEQFYVELSSILRGFVEGHYRLSAPKLTTEEFIARAARDAWLDPATRQVLGEFLQAADMVKFARHDPPVSEAEAAWQTAWQHVAAARTEEPS